ncbi:MAG: exodeoxyribonuclease V subunit gamma, partial [Deltaproteobacteria bacterium]|nr:exodeoxyribonuclease V subunit gamma [Deltaproteobacteria bacterium]
MPNPGFNVFTSNRLETLIKQLALELRSPLSSPLEKDLVIVQSQGMARWVSMELARINGICANCFFPFPNAFLNHLCMHLLPNVSESPMFTADALAFRIMSILPGCLHKPPYNSLKSYLADDSEGVKLFQLSSKIADLFDQYLVFRPGMILGWEQGETPIDLNQHWQADLWMAISPPEGAMHRARLRERLLEILSAATADVQSLPKRVSAFGISHLPLFHLQVLKSISKHVQVDLFLMNPCREYWEEIVTSKDIRRIRQQYASRDIEPQDLHLDKGNKILSTMGAMGKDFLSMISDLGCDAIEMFESPHQRTMLSTVQADILDLVEPSAPFDVGVENREDPREGECKASCTVAGDSSIAIHACHSPMREIEVLYDSLLAMLDEDPDLMPRDILVMIPNIETYAPFIYAVFDTVTEDRMRIPFSVADRSIIKESRIVDAFMTILELTESRMEAGRVLYLLEYPAIREKFGLAEADLFRLEEWVKDVNIRWGKDAASRSKLGLPAMSENTWNTGLQRLLLGLAMTGNDRNLFSGILPYDNMEGEDSLLLGRFLDFLECLFRTCQMCEHPKTASQWAAVFFTVLDEMFSCAGPFERDIQTLRRVVDRMAENARVSGFENTLGIEVVKACLRNSLGSSLFNSGFISGGVTFCAMLPMRSIPFKVICLVGQNTDEFPRDVRRLSFDLMASHPIKGDRSRREDDKYLFLEALISARKTLYISYIGQNVQDNTPIVPSVLVSELIDYIHDRFGVDSHELVTRHPLQAFSPKYFQEESPLFSYSHENFVAAAQQHTNESLLGFADGGLEPPSDEWRQLDVETLVFFFKNPARFLLQRRLGIVFEELAVLPDDRENFRLEGLNRYLVEQDLFRHQAQGIDLDDLKPALIARGILPHAEIGSYEFNRMSRDIKNYGDFLATYIQGRRPASQAFELVVGNYTLTGSLPGIYGNNCLYFRYTRSNPGDMIRLWIYHLVRCCLTGSLPGKSWYIARDTAFEFTMVGKSHEILASLLSIFWE